MDTTTITGLPGTDDWYGGVLAPNGKIYCVPCFAPNVLIIDPRSKGSFRSNVALSGYFNKL